MFMVTVFVPIKKSGKPEEANAITFKYAYSVDEIFKSDTFSINTINFLI